MGSGALWGGVVAGYGKAVSERNKTLMEQEIERREGLVQFYQTLANDPKMPPELRQKFLEFQLKIHELPYDKKLPKEVLDLSSVLKERQQLQGPMGPPSAAIGEQPEPPRPTPEGLMSSAMGEAEQAGVPYAPPGGGFEEQLPAEQPGQPAPGLRYTPEQWREIQAAEARGATASAINVANQYKKANLRPPGFDPNLPIELAPGEMAVPTGPSGEMLPEGAIQAPPGAPTGEGPGSFDAYARAGLLAAGWPNPDDVNDRPADRNVVVEQLRREWEKDPVGVFLPLANSFGEIIGFYNAQTGESTGPPPQTDLAPGQRVLPGQPPAAPGAPPSPPPPASPEIASRAPEFMEDINEGLESGLGTAGPAARRSGISIGERDKEAAMKVMLQDVDRLRYYAGLHPEAIGPFWGRYYGGVRQIADVAPGINKMFRIVENLAELLLRARSGAQINEKEFTRLRNLMPDPRNPDGKFWVDMSEYYLESKRIYESKFGKRYIALDVLPDGSIWEVKENGDRIWLEGGEEPGAE